MTERPRTYLGNGKYVEFDGTGFWLIADDGFEVTNEMYLTTDVIEALEEFAAEKCNKETEK